MKRLKKRKDFLFTARGYKHVRSSLVLQAKINPQISAPHIGFTVTKKVGNAVVRNRVRRRLKEAARLLHQDDDTIFSQHTNYVVVGRKNTLTASFTKIQDDLRSAILAIHQKMLAKKVSSAKKPN